MSDLVHSFLTTTLVITRTAPGSYVNGNWVDGAATTFQVDSNIQNATPDETTMFPEARRGGEMITVITETELIGPNETAQIKGDIFTYNGKLFEVHKVENWSDGTDLPHFKSICVKRDDTTGADDGL